MQTKTPTHVAMILDGNGRWAKAHNKPRTQGHVEGAKALKKSFKRSKKRRAKWYRFSYFPPRIGAAPKRKLIFS